MNKEKIIKAGEIASEVKKYARSLIKKDVLLLEIAEKIENKIQELGAKPAFPVNLSINEIAAHYTPSHDDKTLAHGLLKIDIGVHIDGWIADTAFSLDLNNASQNKKLIQSVEKSLDYAQELIDEGIPVNKIGETISKTIKENNFIPILNLGGHGLEHYNVHSSPFIPNYDNKKNEIITTGLYAIEPFATLKTASGRVYDGPKSEIYQLESKRPVRMPLARDVLNFILKEYNTLPFCSRWIVKKFGTKALIALRQLTSNKNLHNFSQLVEASHNRVAQAENTILLLNREKIITTL